MRLDLQTRVRVTGEVAKRYARAGKPDKGKILDEFCALTGYNRSYAARLLRSGPGKRKPGPRAHSGPGRKPVYTNEVRKALVKVWAVLDCPCGKRLTANLPEVVRVLEKHGELDIPPHVREKLLAVSASTADRLLAGEKKRFLAKCRSRTKPGSLLKHQIKVRTFSDWDDCRPGFLEIDLVGHDGGNMAGDFCQSLDATDVATGWTEIRAVRNKAQKWVFPAIEDIAAGLPFPLLGIDSDNGSEFINDQLRRYCEAGKITFTRSRPYRKNDSCFVEQKNYTAVRRNVGYLRYDTEAELEILNELYRVLCPYLNFFIPQAKLVEKTRNGSRVTKRYDEPRTPYARALASPDVDDLAKRKLRRRYARLNPAELKRRILKLQDRLYKRAVFKGDKSEVSPDDEELTEVANVGASR